MKTKIDWADWVWNPVTGCTPVSAGCDHCYARVMTNRFQMRIPKYHYGFDIVMEHSKSINHFALQAKKWKEPKRVFIGSMADIFNIRVSYYFIEKIMTACEKFKNNEYFFLTKRPQNLAEYLKIFDDIDYSNMWFGVSVENQREMWRILELQVIKKIKNKFISFEPLLGPISDFETDHIKWIIAGGETGPGARPMEAEWVRGIRDKCLESKIPFFFKSWGGRKRGHILDGKEYREYGHVFQKNK